MPITIWTFGNLVFGILDFGLVIISILDLDILSFWYLVQLLDVLMSVFVIFRLLLS